MNETQTIENIESNNQWIRCFFGLHKLEILKEIEVKDVYNNLVGTTIVLKCSNCGKIKTKFIRSRNNVTE